MRKKVLAYISAACIVLCGVNASAQHKVTMYAADGRTVYVQESEVEAYKAVGWYLQLPVLMHSADGRTMYVSGDEVEAYKAVGWYLQPPVLMYAADGRTMYVSGDEVEAYKAVGWYTAPIVKMYAPDGRELFIPEYDVEAYKAVGWYRSELVAADKLANLKSLKRGLNNDQFNEAYDIARQIVAPVLNYGREDQLKYIAVVLRDIFERNMYYSMSSENYNNVYGYFIQGSASCAGCTRATGLCLNILGIPYEHVNENQYSHQWCRVNIGGKYWVCDAFGLFVGEEPYPYGHIYF